MTHLSADASATSATWMTPSELEGILAATWRSAPPPPPRTLKSDAEARASGWSSENATKLLLAFAALGLAMLALRSRRDQTPKAATPATPQPTASGGVQIMERVRVALSGLTNTVKPRAGEIVDRLLTELGRMNVEGMPLLDANVGDDGAFVIEWTLGRRRLGLNVEAKPEDSSWYFVSFEPGQVESASGPLSEVDLPVLLRRLVRK